MNGYLLDTHIWLWSLVEPHRLNQKVKHILEDNNAVLWLSPISVWEALLLGEKKAIDMAPNPHSWVRTAISKTPIQETPFSFEIAFMSRELSLRHNDPADRFIAATAYVHDLILITADQYLLQCKAIKNLKGV